MVINTGSYETFQGTGVTYDSVAQAHTDMMSLDTPLEDLLEAQLEVLHQAQALQVVLRAHHHHHHHLRVGMNQTLKELAEAAHGEKRKKAAMTMTTMTMMMASCFKDQPKDLESMVHQLQPQL